MTDEPLSLDTGEPTSEHELDLDDPARVRAAERLLPAPAETATLQTLASLAARLLGTSYAQVSLVSDVQRVPAASGLDPGALFAPYPRQESLCAVAMRGRGSLEVSDAVTDARVNGLAPVLRGLVGSYLGVPLTDAAGQVVGALCTYDGDPRTWSPSEVTVLEELAAAVVAELERIALTAEHQTTLMRLDLAMDAAGVGSWDWDLTTLELTWDDRLRAMFGFEDGEFDDTIEAFNARVHPDDLPGVTAALEHTMRDGVDFDEVYRVLIPSREIRWVSARGRALRDKSGSVARLIGAARDVTEQLVAEQEHADAQHLLELVARAGQVLAGSLEVEDSVRSLAELLVPSLADWSIVTLVGADGLLHDVASWHRDPALRPAVAQLAAHRLDGFPYAGALNEVMSRRSPVFVGSGGVRRAEQVLRSPLAVAAARELGHESLAVFPLLVEDEVVGMLTLARGPQRPALAGGEASAAADVAHRAGTALDHARSFSRVRDISEQLQRTMLDDPAQSEGLDIAVLYTPASQAARVGGDWYDAFVQPDGSTMLVVGDVIGHDSAAAAAMGQLRSLTRGIAYSSGEPPSRMLARVGRAIEGLHLDTIATVVVAHVLPDPVHGGARMLWSNAGHPPALVLDPDGTSRLLEDHDLLLGLDESEERTDHEAVLAPGSVVLLFTDGLVERRGENIGDGLQHLSRVVEAGRGLSLVDLVAHVHREMVPSDPDDDVAVLAVAVS